MTQPALDRRVAAWNGGLFPGFCRKIDLKVGIVLGLLPPGGQVFRVVPDLRQGSLLVFF